MHPVNTILKYVIHHTNQSPAYQGSSPNEAVEKIIMHNIFKVHRGAALNLHDSQLKIFATFVRKEV